MNYEIVTLSEKTVAGLSARTSNLSPDMQNVIGGLWKSFYSENCHPLIEGKANSKDLGIYTDYAADEKGEYTVMVACEIEEGAKLPEGVTTRKIPSGKYAKFVVRGNMVEAVNRFWQNLWQMKLDRNFICDFEEYQNGDIENCEIHIYIGVN